MCQAYEAEAAFMIGLESVRRHRELRAMGHAARIAGVALDGVKDSIYFRADTLQRHREGKYVNLWDLENAQAWEEGWLRASNELAESPDNAGDVPL
jgi:hypothetical protein